MSAEQVAPEMVATLAADRAPFVRHTRIATTNAHNGRRSVPCSVFVSVKWDGERLSLMGVEGPCSNGDALGSCGQIELRRDDHADRAPFYDRLADVWDRWHMNDARAGCEHQRATWDVSEKLEVVTYGINADAWALKRAAEKEMQRAAVAGEVAELIDAQRFLIGPEWFKDRHTPPDADSPLSGLYDVKKRETKAAGWVRPSEHPRGLLTKPCEVCGYKYGSSWLFEEVPTDVLDFLRGLPDDSERLPATWRHA